MGKKITDRIAGFFSGMSATLKSVVKLAVSSRPVSFGFRRDNEMPLVILANGPSLREAIDSDARRLADVPSLAVNFAANSPEFAVLRPDYYVLADPHFFDHPEDPNVARLLTNLTSADWHMTLFVPVGVRLPKSLRGKSTLTVERFNFLAMEGFRWFENLMFDSRRGMPRPRNVLIPSIMIGMWLGYKTIYLLGADHSWLKTLSVDDDNKVVSVQPHFYKEDEQEVKRIRKDYLHYPLHSILESFTVAFRSYHTIRRYADEKGVRIVNSTHGSFIDAFERGDYREIFR